MSNLSDKIALLDEAGFPELPEDNIIDLFFDGSRFKHNIMGDYLIETLNVCKINGKLHIYTDGIYSADEDVISGHMVSLYASITSHQRNEVLRYMRANLQTPTRNLSPPNMIPFATRIYDIEADVFMEYNPEYVFLNRFPWDYKPDSKDDKLVLDTIAKIADYDKDVIALILEAFGNCFYLVNSYRGAVMLFGRDGNNGKSTLLHMLVCMLGADNVSNLSLQDTAARFRLAEIYGKAANIGDDIPNTFMEDASLFKKLVTGEPVVAEKKGQDPFSMQSYAKFFFAMNEQPRINDKSRAFFSRILLIPLEHDFSNDNMDVKLKGRKWTKEEMESLTKQAMIGLKRLIKNDGFTRPESVTRAIAEYEAYNNPIKSFLDEIGDIDGTIVNDAYFEYKEFCMRDGYRPESKNKFTREVHSLAKMETRVERFGSSTIRVFRKKWVRGVTNVTHSDLNAEHEKSHSSAGL